MAISGVKIILVEPAGPLNVGSVARVMKNFGFNQLVLVNPQCDPLGIEARKMAVHAWDILESTVSVATLPEALQGCRRAIATTGIAHHWEAPLEKPSTALPWLLEEIGQPSALIFGREDRGLTNQELNYAQRFVRIPTSSSYPSLNLATAVAICCYELAKEDKGTEEEGGREGEGENGSLRLVVSTSDSELAPLDVVEAYYQQLESLLLKIGYLYSHTAASRMEKFRQLYNRAQLQTREVSMLRGILRQVEWALENKSDRENS
ncbi:tRNA (cytidine/uridine-2'-O-)-methyltransferase TrmJ [Chlorogloeopsis fritschii PCC 6912]|uniref:tRNA (cytidine/uridine-2'-O-)-methyltransferase TrmJ n=1 Tax=Chlorogloeopsis fritschii PCC 6912 TaxID=211165 RepID=A0A3S0XP69_CHLFR|nr:RNA methyltransferase [Chlorogloeopsis fritschii]RUR74474.1 tRNA (cytidine/uridine-2'-O-)-methyltransferase TrmJ [Chlorogloeopsis fritschii PCC 6912]